MRVTESGDDGRDDRAEPEALRRSEARFRSLIEHAPDGVAIMRWPIIVYTNQVAARLLGFATSEETIGRDLTSLLRPVEAVRANQRVARAKAGERQEPMEYTRVRADGSEITVEISSIPIEYEGGPAILGFARDITERKTMLAQLMQADKLAAVGTLAAGVAHEINNPLAYLLLNLEFMIRELPKLVGDETRLEPMLRRLLETKQGAERVKTIVRDLQTFTHKDEGIRGPVSLEEVITSALDMARHEIRHRATIVQNFEAVPAVHGNATRFEQLFLNLLINAAHAISERAVGENVIELGLREGPRDNVIATVRDNGIGMSQDVLRRIFDPFFTTKPAGVGTGLGLPICHTIVHAVGGHIDIQSTEGQGTVVTVTLQTHRGEHPRPRIPTPQAVTASGPLARVLLIDDERAVVGSLAAALGDSYDVVAVSSAAQAREAIASQPRFDAIICDLVMPGETGMQLFEHVRQTQPELAKRFAFMTGGAFLPETERFLQQIENPYIDKPFDVKAIRRLVAKLLTR